MYLLIVLSFRCPALHLHYGLGQRTAAASRVEVIELAVLQALVGNAEAERTPRDWHRGAVAVQHEHRIGVDPGRHPGSEATRVVATAVDLHLVAIDDAEWGCTVGVDPEHLFRRSLVEERVVEGLAVRQRRRLREQEREVVARRRLFGDVRRQAGQPCLFQCLALDFDLARGRRELELVARVSLGAPAKASIPVSRSSETVTAVPSSW